MALTLTGFISTPEIEDVGNIDLEDSGTYRIVELGVGTITWRRLEAMSPYVHGSVLVGATKENPILELTILIEGADADELAANTSALLRAFEQFRYRVGLTINDVDYEWYCQPADYAPNGDGSFRASHMREHVQVYNFLIPRDPTPIEGIY